MLFLRGERGRKGPSGELCWHYVGSVDGRGRGFGARVAGFWRSFAAGRCRWMCGAEAAELGFKRGGKRGVSLLWLRGIERASAELFLKAAQSQFADWKTVK